MRALDLKGRTFGRWTVLEQAERAGVRTTWICQCSCGAVRRIAGASLTYGATQSCGCLKNELISTRSLKHGHNARGSRTSTYGTWTAMMKRCTNPSASNWSYYGGRGISVCSQWSVFEQFLADMGEKPKGMSIDRIDPNGNYEPSNCRWATPAQQRINRRGV